MASTTTNLGLTKPAYSDDADISDINGNMDLIDAEAGRVRANVAANYDSSETYAVGDYCLHDGSLYKCSTAISSPEAWTAGHWTQIKITGELSALNGKIANITITNNELITETTLTGYSTLSNLQINDDALYSVIVSNDDSSAVNLILDLETKNSIPIYQFNYINAPQYVIISSPILFLKSGTYKLRATGTVKLKKYVYRE